MTPPQPTTRSTPTVLTGLLLAGAGAALTAGVWIALASFTGLIFHFLPGAPFLVAGWVLRQVARGRRVSWPEIAATTAAAGAAAIAGALIITSIGRQLDAPLATGLVAVAGAGIGIVWLRRGPSDSVADRHPEVPNA